MWILDRFIGPSLPKETGLILDNPVAVEEAPQYELVFGAKKMLDRPLKGDPSKDWSSYCPPFRSQGSTNLCTAFAGSAIGSIMEKVESGDTLVFSALELFYRSGGYYRGNSLLNTAKAMQASLVLEKDIPTPVPVSWDYYGLMRKSKATQEELERGKNYRMKSAAFVTPDAYSLRQALNRSPVYAAVGIGRGYFSPVAPVTWNYGCYHAVVVTSVDADGNYVIFDSLTFKAGFDGFHRLAAGYPIQSAMTFVDLPDDWQTKQEAAKKEEFSFCLDHYGKKRDFNRETAIASLLSQASDRNPTVKPYIGRYFTVLINAVSYGGYSVTDVLNNFTSIRRGQGPIFDFNQLKT